MSLQFRLKQSILHTTLAKSIVVNAKCCCRDKQKESDGRGLINVTFQGGLRYSTEPQDV